MRRFNNILFVSEEGSDDKKTLARAMALAKSNKGKLTIMDVVKEIRLNEIDADSSERVRYFQDMIISSRRKELEELVGSVADKYPEVDTRLEIKTGDIFIEIIEAVLNNKHDLVIKDRNGSLGPIQMLFGSVDLKLMRKCPCPVWIIKPGKQKHFARILAAVDPDPKKPESLNRLIMDLASSIAAHEKSELIVVHAWHIENEARLNGSQIPKTELNDLIESVRLSHQHQLDLLLNHYRKQNKVTHIIKGMPGEVIPRLAKENNVELIVMGTVGRAGIPGLIIGNTAEKILNTVDCSVLTVKPEGFKFPF
jgi:universal stress protein E